MSSLIGKSIAYLFGYLVSMFGIAWLLSWLEDEIFRGITRYPEWRWFTKDEEPGQLMWFCAALLPAQVIGDLIIGTFRLIKLVRMVFT